MSTWLEPYTGENGGFGYSNGASAEDVQQLEIYGGMAKGNWSYASLAHNLVPFDLSFSICFTFELLFLGYQRSSLVEWLNGMLPHLSLPLEASDKELRACLIDGTVLCSILKKLSRGSIDLVGLPFVMFIYNLFGFYIILCFMTFFVVVMFPLFLVVSIMYNSIWSCILF